MSENASSAARALARRRWDNAGPQERRAHGAAVQDGLRRRFAREIDPEGLLDAEELAVLVEQRRHRHYVEIGRKAAAAAFKRAKEE
ncbi:hypothetical protein [Amycolatopsis sp. WAC 01376]|uniref:hypothetical protein n=1 Tax=Amycolatopsis sp. WAC 01376 TaxID=2203195 RepID=UPI000F78A6B7|nr:hypothetical protein [Amycolatopsis sp. WAC 01376]